jgi:hypothetical protein
MGTPVSEEDLDPPRINVKPVKDLNERDIVQLTMHGIWVPYVESFLKMRGFQVIPWPTVEGDLLTYMVVPE